MADWIDISASTSSAHSTSSSRLEKLAHAIHSPATGSLVLLASLVITISAYIFSAKQVEKRTEIQFQLRQQEILHAIDERLALYEQALRGGVGLFNASDEVGRQEWANYVTALEIEERLPGIQAMGWSIKFNAEALAEHEADMKAEGFPDYRVRPETPRPEYSAIKYIEPFDWRNKRAFGYDMWSNPTRREAMSRAVDEARPVTSGIITLVQETNEDVQRGFLTYLPVYTTTLAPLTVDLRREKFVGWVYAAFRAKDLMKGLLNKEGLKQSFAIYDGEQTNPDNLLYRNETELAEGQAVLTDTKSLSLQTRPWTVVFRANPKTLLNPSEVNMPQYVLTAGIIIDCLLFYVLLTLFFVNRNIKRREQAIVTAYDNNQNILAEQARYVEDKEQEARAFFELVPNALLIVAADGNIVQANQHAHSMFEFHEESLLGQNISRLIPPHLREKHAHLIDSYNNTRSSRQMAAGSALKAVTLTGKTLEIGVNLEPITFLGQPHTVAAVQDLTEVFENERKLAHEREKAEAANRAKSEFLANMSHEIRTPLNAVIGSAQLLEKTELSNKQQKYIHTIRGSGESLLGIINDILDFSKIEAGKMALSPTTFSLDAILSRVAMMMSVATGEKPLNLSIDVSPNTPDAFVGDALRIQQVIVNLCSNAVKFTQEGHVRVVVATEQISKEARQCKLLFAVEDSGIGMTEEQQGNLFQAFGQADTSISRRFGGTGLGLTISNRILAMMNSRILLESEPGKGSRFSFGLNLPLAEHDAPKKPLQAIVLITKSAYLEKSLRLLCERLNTSLQRLEALPEAPAAAVQFAGRALLIDAHYLLHAGAAREALSQQLRAIPPTIPLVILQSTSEVAESFGLPRHAHSCIKPVTAQNLQLALADPSLRHQSQGGGRSSSSFGPARILLVEDNPINQSIAEEMLADMKISVDIANHGAEALELVKRNPDYPMIFMDIQMPVMDGLTATRRLREQLAYNKPIVAMTAGVIETEKQEYLASGIDDIVPKPVEINDLYACLSRYLSETTPKQTTEGVSMPEFSAANAVASAPVAEGQAIISANSRVFNAQRLEQLTRGKPERLKKFTAALRSLLESGHADIEQGRRQIQAGELSTAKETFHTLKGVTANFGAETLREAIQNLEQAINENSPHEQLELALVVIDEHWQAYGVEAREWLRQQPPQP